MSTAQFTITQIHDREHYNDQSAADALHQRVRRLRELGNRCTITETSVTFEQRHTELTERVTIDFRDDEGSIA